MTNPEQQPAQQQTPPPEGIRETIDSIVVALILAFVFRAFIIEAFVIPTGSMASTLDGAHGTMICKNCGWEYTYGLSDFSVWPRDPRSGAMYKPPNALNHESVALCRNCRYPNHTAEINDDRGNYEGGDRILVLKWPFDIGGELLGPQRWNVIVFKDPSDGVTNYIKRLAGLPEEILEIVDGDVYTVPTKDVSKKTLETLDKLRHIKFLRRTGTPPSETDAMENELAADFRDVLKELDKKLQLRPKTPLAQEDLWRTVYNHDYPPQQLGSDQPVWRPDSFAEGWSIESRTLTFDGIDTEEQSVRLYALLDSFCAYNAYPNPHKLRNGSMGLVSVSDLKIRFVIDYRDGDGTVAATLTKRDDVFRAELSADGIARIRHGSVDSPDQWQTVCEANVGKLIPNRKIEFDFSNLDYRVSLSIGGKEVLATTPKEYAPDVARLRREPIPPSVAPAISAGGLSMVLSHVAVESDIYYLSVNPGSLQGYRMKAWGTQNNPILLREGEFFMLGDNSAQSKDSRLWDEVGPHLEARGEAYQLGTVPEDQLIGRAFFVYWPSGLRTSLIPFLRNSGWIPNVGRVRWIR